MRRVWSGVYAAVPGYLHHILSVYVTVDEITFYNESNSNNNLRAFYGITSEDSEFKKLIWSGLLTAI